MSQFVSRPLLAPLLLLTPLASLAPRLLPASPSPAPRAVPGFLRRLPTSLRQEDIDEDEAEEADAAVAEEGAGVAEAVLDVPEGLGDEEPAEVGGEAGQGEAAAERPGGEELGGEKPGEGAEAEAVGGREGDEDGQGQPGQPGRVPGGVQLEGGGQVVGGEGGGGAGAGGAGAQGEQVEVGAEGALGQGHAEAGEQHEEPPANEVPEGEAEQGGEEVGDADDQGAVFGLHGAAGVLAGGVDTSQFIF